jgi:uncharacterized protein (DUF302 family)
MVAYGFGKQVKMSFDDAVQRVTQALAAEGFGVLSEIDVAATLKKKLDKSIPPYKILGACNPNYASKAIEAEPRIGLLLPCNVVVRQDAAGAVHVEFMDPQAVLNLVRRSEIEALGNEVRARLERVMAAL